jgi:hypothetical protein
VATATTRARLRPRPVPPSLSSVEAHDDHDSTASIGLEPTCTVGSVARFELQYHTR